MDLQIFTPIILIAMAFSSSAFAKDKEKQGAGDTRTVVITLAQCPTAIQASMETISEIEAEQEKGGITYDAKLTLAAEGKLPESKEKKAK